MTVSITKKFKLVSFAAVIVMTALSKLFSIVGGILSSDVMISGSDSAFVRFLPSLLSYGAVFCNAAAVSCAVGGVIYALAYFGKKTALRSSLLFLLCGLLGGAVNMCYALFANSMNIVTTLALALTLAVDIIYLALSLAIAAAATRHRLKNEKKAYSPVFAATVVAAVTLIIHIADLTFMSVIPFVQAKADAGRALLSTDIYAIIGDYIYDIAVYGILPAALTLISIQIYKAVTGELMPKVKTNDQLRKEK